MTKPLYEAEVSSSEIRTGVRVMIFNVQGSSHRHRDEVWYPLGLGDSMPRVRTKQAREKENQSNVVGFWEVRGIF